jgi:hypothetical protein
MGDTGSACERFIRKLERKNSCGRLKHIWGNNIETGLREIGWEILHWFHAARVTDRRRVLVNMEINFGVS